MGGVQPNKDINKIYSKKTSHTGRKTYTISDRRANAIHNEVKTAKATVDNLFQNIAEEDKEDKNDIEDKDDEEDKEDKKVKEDKEDKENYKNNISPSIKELSEFNYYSDNNINKGFENKFGNCLCKVEKGKRCFFEDASKIHNPFILGLNSNKITSNIIASQRPTTYIIKFYDLINQFKQ